MARVTLNKKPLEDLLKSMNDIDNKEMQAGWFDSAKYGGDTPVAGIAAQNEYGNAKLSIPPRPYMRPMIDEKTNAWDGLLEKGFKAVVEGKTNASNVMNSLGLKVVADIKISLSTGNFAPLSPITIALRKIRNDDEYKIGGKLVGAVAGAIADGKTGAGELGDQSFGNKDPLRETGYMISTVTYEAT